MPNVNKFIVVIKERWVLIGNSEGRSDGKLHLTDASVIRVWGTTAGLGQIAVQGVQPETILDYCGDVEVTETSVLFTIKCIK